MEKNIAPVDMGNIPLFTGFHTCQVVQDFFHQQFISYETWPEYFMNWASGHISGWLTPPSSQCHQVTMSAPTKPGVKEAIRFATSSVFKSSCKVMGFKWTMKIFSRSWVAIFWFFFGCFSVNAWSMGCQWSSIFHCGLGKQSQSYLKGKKKCVRFCWNQFSIIHLFSRRNISSWEWSEVNPHKSTVNERNPAPVEVGSLSHYLQGHPNGAWPWVFSHQPYECRNRWSTMLTVDHFQLKVKEDLKDFMSDVVWNYETGRM